MKQGDWLRQLLQRLKKRKLEKTDFLILVLVGILLLVIAMPVGNKKEEGRTEERTGAADDPPVADTSASGEELEERLEDILSQIEGAGRVEVMITYKDSGTYVVEKDITTSDSTGEEAEDSVSRNTKDVQSQETTVYDKTEGGDTPFISQELNPRIEGILVVASGGDDAVVKQNISEAVLALFPVEAHRIKIVKMNWQEGGQ